MTIHFVDTNCEVKNKRRRPCANIRIKSRQATLSDCTHVLEPGVDVCVLSSSEKSESLQEEKEVSEPVWVDATISSIARKPHATECTCRFLVNLHVNPGPLGSQGKDLSKDIEEVGIHQISILQKLANGPCQSQFYGWNVSNNCILVQQTNLLLRPFLLDVESLMKLSVEMKFACNVKTVQEKLICQILEGDDPYKIRCVNFMMKKRNRELIWFDLNFNDPWVPWVEPVTSYDVLNLRKSKRLNRELDAFLACLVYKSKRRRRNFRVDSERESQFKENEEDEGEISKTENEEEHSQLSREAHDYAHSIPELSNEEDDGETENEEDEGEISKTKNEEEHSQLSREAHDYAHSIPELSNEEDEGETENEEDEGEISKTENEEEHSQLSHEAHDYAHSIPELSKVSMA